MGNRIVYFTISLICFIYASCDYRKIHSYTETRGAYPHRDKTHEEIIDLSGYDAYYRVIYRRESKLEKVYAVNEKKPIVDDVHIKDIQYILINPTTNQFIQFTYIPIRYVSASGNYLDRAVSYYDTTINIYDVNLIFAGNIVNDNMVFLFEDGNETRFLKHEFSYDRKTLIIQNLFYPAQKKEKNKSVNLDRTFQPEYLSYRKMEKFNLYSISNKNECCELENKIVLAHFIHNINNQSNGKKNMIIFEYKDQSDGITNFYFKERGDRFNFIYPIH